ncbi:MAG: AzlC family ABC transporter permease [Rhizobiaceae bacterium]|nr:AzlC family ABC transporter permease [Rhizobiaceae bacterium]
MSSLTQTCESPLPVPAASPSSEAKDALRRIFPVLLAVFPFGMLYGAVAVEAGLTTAQAMGFSAAVYAGASQFVALEMMGIGSPVAVVAVSVFALNFRHVLYSASVGRQLGRFSPIEKAAAFFFLVDPVFGEAEARAAQGPLTRTYYFVYCIVLYVSWLVSTFIGAVFGGLIEDPAIFGLDFILPVYFLTLLMGFRARARFYPVAAASFVTSTALYLTVGAPWHVTFGALGGILYAVIATPGGTTPAGIGKGGEANAAGEPVG